MTEIAKELEDTIDYKLKSSLETLSKGALYLRMLYNQVSQGAGTSLTGNSSVHSVSYSLPGRSSFAS